PPLTLPSELDDPVWSGFLCLAKWPVNWLLVYDNQADPMHGPFLHTTSHTLSRGLKFDRLRVRPLGGDGFCVEREGQRGVNLDWAELYTAPTVYWRLDIPLPRSGGPGGPLRILGWTTPVDENSSLVVLYRLRQLGGWRRTLWRALYRAVWERRHWGVIEQDRLMLESQRGLGSRLYEHLAQTDLGVVHLRQRLNREYARQHAVYEPAAAAGRRVVPARAEVDESAPGPPTHAAADQAGQEG